ncbi:Na+/H+ antiporter NhaA, partial [Campylobacter coli]
MCYQEKQSFLQNYSETFPGILLIFFTLLALLFKNSSLSVIYTDFFHANFTIGFDH